MKSILRDGGTWLQRHVAWSNSWQSWQERLGLLAILGGTAALVWYSTSLSVAQQAVLWGLLALAVAVLLRRGWLRLFGPVLFYDMVRTARRTRYVIFRCLYAAFIMFVLFWIYATWMADHSDSFWDFLAGGRIPPRVMPEFAQSFFFTFMAIQFLTVCVLTPAYTAGAIAEEKDRKTLEFLLATDLRNREIVLSKLASRVINLTLFVLTGLPILSLMQFLGGVDPDLVLATFAATAISMVSLASFSIFNSVMLKKPLHAIVLTYLGAVAYAAVTGLSWLLLLIPEVAAFPTNRFWPNPPVTVADLVYFVNTGNIFSAVGQLIYQLSTGGRIDQALPAVLRDYAIFHGLLALVCTTWAVARLRAVALKQTYGEAKKLSVNIQVFGRPRIGHFPMLWKELFAEPGMGRSWLVRAIVAILVVTSFAPLFAIFVAVLYALMNGNFQWRHWDEVTWVINIAHVRVAGTAVACLLLLAVAVRAAGSISGERDRQTFDSLLTSPLGSDSILFAKWLGSILSVRWGWLWLGAFWMLGLLTGSLHILAVPLLIVAWVVFAAFVAALGVWYSMVCRTTLRAILWTLLSLIGLSFGHYIFVGCATTVLLIVFDGRSGEWAGWVMMFETFGMTPPITYGGLGLHWEEFDRGRWEPFEAWPRLITCLTSLFCWGMFAVMLYGLASDRFRKITGRIALRRPDRAPPARKPTVPPPAVPDSPLEVLPAEAMVDGPDRRPETRFHAQDGQAPMDGNAVTRADGEFSPESTHIRKESDHRPAGP